MFVRSLCTCFYILPQQGASSKVIQWPLVFFLNRRGASLDEYSCHHALGALQFGDHIMIHLKPCPEAGKWTTLSDYGPIVSAQISWCGCMKFKVVQLPDRRLLCITSIQHRGCWSLSYLSLGERQGTPWTARQSITGPHRDKWDKQPSTLTLTPRDNLEKPINLTCMFLGGGWKPEYPERTHAYMGIMHSKWSKIKSLIANRILFLFNRACSWLLAGYLSLYMCRYSHIRFY